MSCDESFLFCSTNFYSTKMRCGWCDNDNELDSSTVRVQYKIFCLVSFNSICTKRLVLSSVLNAGSPLSLLPVLSTPPLCVVHFFTFLRDISVAIRQWRTRNQVRIHVNWAWINRNDFVGFWSNSANGNLFDGIGIIYYRRLTSNCVLRECEGPLLCCVLSLSLIRIQFE